MYVNRGANKYQKTKKSNFKTEENHTKQQRTETKRNQKIPNQSVHSTVRYLRSGSGLVFSTVWFCFDSLLVRLVFFGFEAGFLGEYWPLGVITYQFLYYLLQCVRFENARKRMKIWTGSKRNERKKEKWFSCVWTYNFAEHE